MSGAAPPQNAPGKSQASSEAARAGALLQRKCACGGSAGLTGECQACKEKKLQRKLSIGASNDPLEQEADRIADQVMSASARLSARRSPLRIQRATGGGSGDLGTAPASVDRVLAGPGKPLDPTLQREMSHRIGYNFSQVSVYTGASAGQSARDVNAYAYTVGNKIVFDEGRYAPRTAEGLRLLTHELTHVVQQRSAQPRIQRVSAGTKFLRGLRDVLFFIPSLFGAELNYSDAELKDYLDGVTASGQPDGGYYSDDKARQVVKRWKAGNATFALTPKQKSILIREMQGGIVTDGDREGIMTILMNSSGQLGALLGPASINFPELLKDLDSGSFKDSVVLFFLNHTELHRDLVANQFSDWFAKENFDAHKRALAKKVVRDILDVKSGLSFTDAKEFKAEVAKRVDISVLMTESQTEQQGKSAFNYPENMTASDNCPDYKPPPPGQKINLSNARVNKAARQYWTGVEWGAASESYYFDLTREGLNNPYKALTTLFVPQKSICDQTLIHCDYLVNVIEFRAYAESLGADKFNSYVKDGRIHMRLTYTGFPYDAYRDPRSPKALGYMQNVRPASKADLLIGDHVIFWNHLAFDGLNVRQGSPWRLENAVLTDKDSGGRDLFQGHGSGPAQSEHKMLVELAQAYNGLANDALSVTQQVDLGQPGADTKRQQEYPDVIKESGHWVVVDPGRQPARANHRYPLQKANEQNPESDKFLPGLLDPLNRNQLSQVDRPIESAPGRPPQP